MCLIIYSPAGKLIERDVFDYAQAVNSDGIGVMSKHGVEKFVGKKCRKRAYRYLRLLLEANGPTPYGVHFRWRTHGAVNLENCHPFKAAGSDAYIMHNGVIGVTSAAASAVGGSDTKMFVDMYMAGAPTPVQTGYESFYKLVAKLISYTNKLLIMHAKTGEFTLCNEDEGLWKDGFWYSNDYSVPMRISGHAYGIGTELGTDYAMQTIGTGAGSAWMRAWGLDGQANGNARMIATDETKGYIRGQHLHDLNCPWPHEDCWCGGEELMKQTGYVVDKTNNTIKLLGYDGLPRVDEYLKMTPEEQEYADSMVANRQPRDYYEGLEDENPDEFCDAGADLGGQDVVTGDQLDEEMQQELMEIQQDHEQRSLDPSYLEELRYQRTMRQMSSNR